MKPLKEVEETRKEYHAKPMQNTVHRSSLLVPQLKGTDTQISFLNHFLLKRNNKDVICKLTALDKAGAKIHCESFPVEGPRVYQISLTDLFPESFHSCIVEFFSGANLFIPFPAVMVNHVGTGFVNALHSYNRVLNDVFEDDAINTLLNKESSIDVRVDDEFDTFILFTAGVADCDQSLRIELTDREHNLVRDVPVSAKRLSHHWLSLKEIFPGFRTETKHGAVLKVQQPRQSFFYGRVLGGRVHQDGSFSANHSYYDCTEHPEYWDDASVSFKSCPFFPGFENAIRIHPVVAPGRLSVSIQLYDLQGKVAARSEPRELVSPGREVLEISANHMAALAGLKESEISTFTVLAEPLDGKAPTRIGAQIIYGKGQLEASINAQLSNPNTFISTRKKNLVWGQVILGAGFESWLGITSCDGLHEASQLELTFYSEQGELGRKNYTLPKNCALRLHMGQELEEALRTLDLSQATCIWYSFESDRTDMAGYTVTNHKQTLHCTGEHSF